MRDRKKAAKAVALASSRENCRGLGRRNRDQNREGLVHFRKEFGFYSKKSYFDCIHFTGSWWRMKERWGNQNGSRKTS